MKAKKGNLQSLFRPVLIFLLRGRVYYHPGQNQRFFLARQTGEMDIAQTTDSVRHTTSMSKQINPLGPGLGGEQTS